MRWKFLLLLFFAAYGGAAAEPQHEATFPFKFRDGFLWVEVIVPGIGEPLQMLLDSGAEVSTVNVEAAKRLGLKGGRRVTVLGVGSKGTGRWPVRFQGTAGNIPVPEEFLVTDLCEVQESCQCRVDGLLGADFFWGRVVQIDFAAKTVRVLKNAPEDTEAQRVPIRFRRKIMQVPIGIGSGAEQWMRLDTGCASAVEWVSKENAGRTRNTRVSIGLAELHPPTVREIVCVGDRCFENIPVGIHESAFFASEGGLLGLGLLGQFAQITIDGKRGQLLLSGSKP